MDRFLQEIGARVRKARMSKHLSQAQLAEQLNLTPPYISHIETGKQVMSVRVLAKLSDVLGVSADWILRNNTTDALAITHDEISELLSDCTPTERSAILRMITELKRTLHNSSS
jgi:transcriptional regulator with XRE-family HTH domain